MMIDEYHTQLIEKMINDIKMSLKHINELHLDNVHPDVNDLINQIDFSTEELERAFHAG